MQIMTKVMKISRLVALAGSVLTLTQIFLLAGESDGICFNDGCKIVDSLTAVPPIFFNIGGFLFFQIVFWGIWLAKERQERMLYVNVILLAGLAAEGVLVSFQHFVAQVFCSYCLIVLAFVVLLNVLAGVRQTLTGATIFIAIVTGFFSLQFSPTKADIVKDLDLGSFAVLSGQRSEQKSYLFFSSNCQYCEKVIDSLKEENSCTMRFNPIDQITDFSLDKAEKAESYSVDINRRFLKSMGIEQIPVLLSVNPAGLQVVKGEGPIKKFLQKSCVASKISPANEKSIGFSSSTNLDFVPPGFDDSCSVNTDCDTPAPMVQ